MSDEESFVILGTSPMSSLENDGMEGRNHSANSLLQSDRPGSRFTSLKNSQICDLRLAQEPEKGNLIEKMPMKSLETSKQMAQMDRPIVDPIKQQKSANKEQGSNDGKLWSISPQVQVEENIMPLSLEDCALKSPLEQQQKSDQCIKQKISSTLNQENTDEDKSISSTKTSPSSSLDSNLAASFIMGEVNSDVLKNSVYSQFPSISVDACAEDVVKLQNMVTDNIQLKTTIKKANNTMKQFYNSSLQWKDKMRTVEEQCKQQLDNCQKEIEELRKKNEELEINFKTQIEALEIARKKDREENIKEISEKNAVLENMRAQIIKLEQQQLVKASFEFVTQNQDNQQMDQFNQVYITEHEVKIKDLQTQLSELVASNLDLKDIEKQYLDELNCLKVNLTAAEELFKINSAEIAQLKALNIETQQKVHTLEDSLKSLQFAHDEQKERISLLETQNEVYRLDFQIEKEGRETAVKEKQQLLQDLRLLQKKNQELIEEHQKIAEDLHKKFSAASINDTQINAASAAAQTYFNNPQRPIRVLPPPSPTAVAPSDVLHMCPVCNKGFKSINILLSHVNECADKNFK